VLADLAAVRNTGDDLTPSILPPNATAVAGAGATAFRTTHWSVVQLAGSGGSPEAQAAMAALFRAYWYPAYAFVRRSGHDPATAQDVVQEVFLALVSKEQLASVGPGRGRFRSYLLAAINHHLANEWNRRHSQKRGGGAPHVSLDSLVAEDLYSSEPIEQRTPEFLFDRRWALTLLDRASAALENEWKLAGKSDSFNRLQPYLAGDHDAPPYADTAAVLDSNEGAVRVAIHRLRRRYRELVRQEIAATVDSPGEIDDEIRYLMQILRSSP
jgi:RNA polymerase sigma-70 factor (ECF subfamily)